MRTPTDRGQRPTNGSSSPSSRSTYGSGVGNNSVNTRGRDGAFDIKDIPSPSDTDVTLNEIYHDVYKNSIAENLIQSIFDESILPADRISALQYLLQYLQSEQNYQRQLNYNELSYERSRAYNQVAEMMNAGMSRAAALQALQGGSTPQAAAETQGITPYQPQFNPLDLFNTIIGGVGSLANIGSSLATLPASLKAKQLTNQLLSHQGALLGSQVQGLNDAALFMQAVANAPDDVQKMKLYDQIKYFRNQASLSEKVPEYNFAAAAFGRTAEFARSMSNPFFYSAVNSAQKDTNMTFASLFEPEKAQELIKSMRASKKLVETQEQNFSIANKLLSNQEYISTATLTARAELEALKVACETSGLTFDNERAQAMLERIGSYTQFDQLALQAQIDEISQLQSPEIYKKRHDELVSSLDFNVAMYHYSHSIERMKELGIVDFVNEDGSANDTAKAWLKDYFKMQEFAGNQIQQTSQGWWRTAFSGVTAGSALAFGGFKIWQGLSAKAAAAAATAGYTVSNTAAALVAPLVVPTFMQSTHPNFTPLYMGGATPLNQTNTDMYLQ